MADTNPSVLRALAERCSKEGPSWQLDDAIAQAVFGLPSCGTAGPFRSFTRNIDHALTLALDWMSVTLTTGGDQGSLSYVQVFIDPTGVHWSDAQGNTPALAVCSALLNGRADAEEWAMHYIKPSLALIDGDA
ncbi:MAG: hypothetical protein ACLGSH_01810 [Acidobacteriota bacterium]